MKPLWITLLRVAVLLIAVFDVNCLPANPGGIQIERNSDATATDRTLTEEQKQKIALLFKGIGPVLGPFSKTERSAAGPATAPAGLSLDDPNLNALLGNDINWEKQPDTVNDADVEFWESGANPKQIHLSFGNSSTEMVVMWATKDPIQSVAPTVWYGLKDNHLTFKQMGHTVSFYKLPEYVYRTNQINYQRREYVLQYLYQTNESYYQPLEYHHRVVLKDLLPNSTYYYRISCDHCYSPTNSFTTVPKDQHWPVNLLVYGDMGRLHKAPILESLIEDVATGDYDSIFHIGDFAYDLHSLNGLMGDSFFNQIEPLAAKVPYMVCPGNHEMDYGPAALQYVHRFSMPQLPWPMDKTNLWYSFDIGNIHFVSYSTELFFSNRSADEVERQKTWLEQDLMNANAKSNQTRRPWIIVFGHRPMYCSNNDYDDCTSNTSKVRHGLEDLFFQQGVDLIIQAHEHSYERLWPVFNGTLWGRNYTDPGAPVHIVSGAAGCNEQYSICSDPILGSKGPWSAYHSWVPGTYSYARLQVVNNTHLYWEQILGVNRQVIDSFWLVQHHHGPFSKW